MGKGWSRRRLGVAIAAVAVPLALVACGESEDPTGGDRSAPDPASFPAADGRTLEQIASDTGGASEELVVLPAGQVLHEGANRLGLGVFTVENEPVSDAEVAIYTARSADEPAEGPFTAAAFSLRTKPAFTTALTSSDPDSTELVYTVQLRLDQEGPLQMLALVRANGATEAVRVPVPAEVGAFPGVPQPGDRAPAVHTPTADDVSELSEIDTRTPPSTMHDDDLADVIGERPVVLLFATPALCQSRVCGPVVDVAEQVKAEYEDADVAWIHMEIFENNEFNPNRLREQVLAYRLPTEPWLFVIDRDGRIDTAIEGAFGISELEDAVAAVSR